MWLHGALEQPISPSSSTWHTDGTLVTLTLTKLNLQLHAGAGGGGGGGARGAVQAREQTTHWERLFTSDQYVERGMANPNPNPDPNPHLTLTRYVERGMANPNPNPDPNPHLTLTRYVERGMANPNPNTNPNPHLTLTRYVERGMVDADYSDLPAAARREERQLEERRKATEEQARAANRCPLCGEDVRYFCDCRAGDEDYRRPLHAGCQPPTLLAPHPDNMACLDLALNSSPKLNRNAAEPRL